MPTSTALATDEPIAVERIDRAPRNYTDSHELDGWIIIADGDNYRSVKTETVAWLRKRRLDADDAAQLDLRVDFLAGVGQNPTIRTRLRREPAGDPVGTRRVASHN